MKYGVGVAIKLEMLRCFVTVVDQGALSTAAETLGKTPAALSMTLKQFEETLGSPLFETSRKSKLTNFGELVYEEARHSVSQFKNSVSVINGLSRSEIGYLRLLATPSVASNILPPLISRFMERFPGVRLEIRDMDSTAINHEMRRGRADIGIGTLIPQGDLEHFRWFADDFGVVCRIDHPLAQKRKHLQWHDLQGSVLIANGLCDLIPDADFKSFLAQSQLQVPSINALMGLIGEGVGISVLPRLAVTQMSKDVIFLPLHKANAQRVVSILSQPKSRLMPAAVQFLELILSERDLPTA